MNAPLLDLKTSNVTAASSSSAKAAAAAAKPGSGPSFAAALQGADPKPARKAVSNKPSDSGKPCALLPVTGNPLPPAAVPPVPSAVASPGPALAPTPAQVPSAEALIAQAGSRASLTAQVSAPAARSLGAGETTAPATPAVMQAATADGSRNTAATPAAAVPPAASTVAGLAATQSQAETVDESAQPVVEQTDARGLASQPVSARAARTLRAAETTALRSSAVIPAAAADDAGGTPGAGSLPAATSATAPTPPAGSAALAMMAATTAPAAVPPAAPVIVAGPLNSTAGSEASDTDSAADLTPGDANSLRTSAAANSMAASPAAGAEGAQGIPGHPRVGPEVTTPGDNPGAAAGLSPTGPTSIAAVAAPTVTLQVHARVDSADFPQGVAERVSWMVENGLNGAKLQVNPPQLGPIELRIAVQGDQAQVWMVSHSAATRDALQSSSPILREMLGAQGFGQVSVDISQRSFHDRSAQSQSYEQTADTAQSAAATTAVAAVAGTSRPSRGALDAYA